MASTYSTNNDIILPTGQELDFSTDLNKASRSNLIDNSRVQAYNYINSKLRNTAKTAVPATDTIVTDQLKEIEKNFVIGWLIGAGLTGDRGSSSEWPNFYLDLAEKALDNLSFPATASAITYESYNTGNGTIAISRLNDQFTKTEQWELAYTGNDYFTVYGTKTGALPSLKVGENYPDEELINYYNSYDEIVYSDFKYSEYPFYCSVTAGSTDFALYDRIIFWSYSSSFFPKMVDSTRIRRAG